MGISQPDVQRILSGFQKSEKLINLRFNPPESFIVGKFKDSEKSRNLHSEPPESFQFEVIDRHLRQLEEAPYSRNYEKKAAEALKCGSRSSPGEAPGNHSKSQNITAHYRTPHHTT